MSETGRVSDSPAVGRSSLQQNQSGMCWRRDLCDHWRYADIFACTATSGTPSKGCISTVDPQRSDCLWGTLTWRVNLCTYPRMLPSRRANVDYHCTTWPRRSLNEFTLHDVRMQLGTMRLVQWHNVHSHTLTVN